MTRVTNRLGMCLVAGALASSAAYAELELVDGKLKADGFIDMSATYKDTDEGSDKTISFDQWEMDLYFTAVSNVTGRVDINDVKANDDGVVVEQAFVDYNFENGFKARGGKFLTPLGYEGAEPTLLYQYSVSATIIGYPGYANGAALMYDMGFGTLYGSVVDGSFSGDQDGEDVSYEGQIKLFPAEGLTLQAGYAEESFDPLTAEDGTVTEGYDKSVANFWAEYKTGALTVAAEYNAMYDIQGAGSDGDGYLVMGNYSFGKAGLTLRHSAAELDNDYEDTEFTISPSYKVSENLLTLFEYRHDDLGDAGDTDTYALEATFTF